MNAAEPLTLARAMKKQVLSSQEVARLLSEVAKEVGMDEFAELAADVLRDCSPDEIAAIGELMPPAVQELLPKRVLQ